MAEVLAKQLLIEEEFRNWYSLSDESRTLIKQRLLTLLRTEKDEAAQASVATVVALLGANSVGKGEWPELLPAVGVLACSHDPSQRIAALRVVAEIVETAGSTPLEPIAAQLKQTLTEALGAPPSLVALRLAAFRASADFIKRDSPSLEHFADVFPLLLKCTVATLNERDETTATKMLSSLVELAEETPSLFKPCISDVVGITVSFFKKEFRPFSILVCVHRKEFGVPKHGCRSPRRTSRARRHRDALSRPCRARRCGRRRGVVRMPFTHKHGMAQLCAVRAAAPQ